jgi:hypothetical protein
MTALPWIDDLETSMRLAIPRDRLQRFVQWGATLATSVTFDNPIIGWRNSLPIQIITWQSLMKTPGVVLISFPPRLGIRRWASNHPIHPLNPNPPIWCRMVLDERPPNYLHPVVTEPTRYRVCDHALTWCMHSSFDDLDVDRLVTVFDAFLMQLEGVLPRENDESNRKRKHKGFQEWSATDARIARRTQCPMAILVCVLSLLHAVVPSKDDPAVLVFTNDAGIMTQTTVVVLDNSAINPIR